jgi:hypothetical protein
LDRRWSAARSRWATLDRHDQIHIKIVVTVGSIAHQQSSLSI